MRHSGDVFDANAHASGAGSSHAQATRRDPEEPQIATNASHAHAFDDPATFTKSRRMDDPCAKSDVSSSMRATSEREMQAGGMASEAPVSGSHGAAFVRRELLKRSEEQAQRDADALFEVRACSNLLPHTFLPLPLGNVQ